MHTGTQVPLGQLVVPFRLVHVLPHAPQLLVVLRLTSQPLLASPSQLPKPPLHTMLHVLPVHDAVPLVLEHTVPHAPQWFRLLVVLISQPLSGLPSQFWKPDEQVPSVHVPDAHDSAALAKSHTAPHAPQFDRVRRSVSQPLVLTPSQLAKFASQLPS